MSIPAIASSQQLRPWSHPNQSIDALWFVGSGLVIVVAAGANFVAVSSVNLRSRMVLAAINLAFDLLFRNRLGSRPATSGHHRGVLFLCLAVCTLPTRTANTGADAAAA